MFSFFFLQNYNKHSAGKMEHNRCTGKSSASGLVVCFIWIKKGCGNVYFVSLLYVGDLGSRCYKGGQSRLLDKDLLIYIPFRFSCVHGCAAVGW